jgi:uroporphyrinogen decarboxylase
LAHTTADEAAIARLEVPDLANLAYVFDAIAEVKHALANRVPLIGFAGSPFTLACYMIEGVGGGEFEIARRMAYERPDLLAQLCEINARAVTGYLTAQIEAGADVVMLFDTWGGLLSAAAWRRFSLASMRAVLAGLPKATPAIVFTKGGGAWLDDLAASGAACVGIDWTVDLALARNGIGKRVAIQGNLDPLVLLTDPDTVARQTADLIRAAGPAPGHVFNLGHGIRPGTPPENVAALIETVHRISARSQALA